MWRISLVEVNQASISFVVYLGLEVDVEVGYVLLHQGVQLVHAQPQLCHGGLEHLPHPVVLHYLHQHGEGILLWHLEHNWPILLGAEFLGYFR